jgi:CRISPR-associated protein Cmr1
MFIGDAEQKATDLRPPSIKGALRFWWRALNWKKFLASNELNNELNIVEALQDLHKEESRLFGSAAKDLHKEESRLFGSAATNNDGGGQGCFLLQVSKQPKINPDDTWPKNANSGSGYLGFGLMESGKEEEGNFQAHRAAINEIRNEFVISLIFKPKTSNSDIEAIKETLEIWGLFGGLGSRVRNGFGSVSLLSSKLNDTEEKYHYSLDEYCTKINGLLTSYNDIKTYPPYTAFSQYSRFKVIKSSETEKARESHNLAGDWYKEKRLGLKWEKRISLGLPLNVDDSVNASTSLGRFLTENENIRRSSPLIFHVQQLKNKKFVTGILYLPAQFHPKYPEEPKPYPHIELTNFYQPAIQLMDSL